MNTICGSVGIPGAKHGMLELIPQTLERASANTEGGSGYPRLAAMHIIRVLQVIRSVGVTS